MRIDFYLNHIFHYSKQEIKNMIAHQRVSIEDHLVEKINEEVFGKVYVDHQEVREPVFIYVMYHKPKGVLSDIHQGILDHIDIKRKEDLRIMGRLDKDTTGMMILTNDHRLIKEITLPGKHTKTYIVTLKYKASHLEELSNGVIIDSSVKCLPAQYEIIDDYHIQLTIREGKYHQIKKMMKSLNNEVVDLHRIAINQLFLDLDIDQYRLLNEDDLKRLKGDI